MHHSCIGPPGPRAPDVGHADIRHWLPHAVDPSHAQCDQPFVRHPAQAVCRARGSHDLIHGQRPLCRNVALHSARDYALLLCHRNGDYNYSYLCWRYGQNIRSNDPVPARPHICCMGTGARAGGHAVKHAKEAHEGPHFGVNEPSRST
jgi:hypothetical protein